MENHWKKNRHKYNNLNSCQGHDPAGSTGSSWRGCSCTSSRIPHCKTHFGTSWNTAMRWRRFPHYESDHSLLLHIRNTFMLTTSYPPLISPQSDSCTTCHWNPNWHFHIPEAGSHSSWLWATPMCTSKAPLSLKLWITAFRCWHTMD